MVDCPEVQNKLELNNKMAVFRMIYLVGLLLIFYLIIASSGLAPLEQEILDPGSRAD